MQGIQVGDRQLHYGVMAWFAGPWSGWYPRGFSGRARGLCCARPHAPPDPYSRSC